MRARGTPLWTETSPENSELVQVFERMFEAPIGVGTTESYAIHAVEEGILVLAGNLAYPRCNNNRSRRIGEWCRI